MPRPPLLFLVRESSGVRGELYEMQNSTVPRILLALSVICFCLGESVLSTSQRTGILTTDKIPCHHRVPHGLGMLWSHERSDLM